MFERHRFDGRLARPVTTHGSPHRPLDSTRRIAPTRDAAPLTRPGSAERGSRSASLAVGSGPHLDPVHRRPDGSIDLDHYLASARRMRAEEFQAAASALSALLRAII